MSQSTTPEEEQAEPQSKAELLARIDHAWSQLEQTIQRLSDEQLTASHEDHGWSVKDHLVHITAWEQSLLALLQGRDRDQALGVGDTGNQNMESDEANDIIYRRNRQRTLADVQTAFAHSHSDVVAAIAALSDADLHKPYSHYQPNDPPDNDDPVIGWIVGNTYEHYDEHRSWIQSLATSNGNHEH